MPNDPLPDHPDIACMIATGLRPDERDDDDNDDDNEDGEYAGCLGDDEDGGE